MENRNDTLSVNRNMLVMVAGIVTAILCSVIMLNDMLTTERTAYDATSLQIPLPKVNTPDINALLRTTTSMIYGFSFGLQ